MVISIKYNRLPGFSKIFLDFLYSLDEFFIKRLPANDPSFFSLEYITKRAKEFDRRPSLVDLIKSSSKCIDFSQKQIESIECLSKENSVVVSASCFPSLLSGPLSNYLKIFSTILLANHLKKKFSTIDFVPVLWVDDDRVGSSEWNRVYTYDSFLNFLTLDYFFKHNPKLKVAISNVIFEKNINDFITFFGIISKLEDINPSLWNFLQNIYVEGAFWCDAFINSINYFFGETGLLYARSSLARKHRLFSPLVAKEIESLPQSFELLAKSLRTLQFKKYQFHLKSSVPNLQFHLDKEIYSIMHSTDMEQFQIKYQLWKYSDFIEFSLSHLDSFSPNVMLKPVFQNYVMPTVSMVVSASEIAHFLLLLEVFEFFNVSFPLIFPRYSASIILKDLYDIENDGYIARLIDKINIRFHKENINTRFLNFLFPKNNLQERLITSFYFLSIFGKKKFRECLNELAIMRNDHHHIILW